MTGTTERSEGGTPHRSRPNLPLRRRMRRRVRRWVRSDQYKLHRIAAVAVFAVLIAAAVWLIRMDRPHNPAPPPRALGYTITYAVTVTIGKPERSTKIVSVRRPFEARDETYREGKPAEAQIFITSRNRSISIDKGKAIDYGPHGPTPTSVDYQLASQLPELLRAGLAEERGESAFAGRRCRLYRIGGPISMPFDRPSEKEHADVCIDADGLMLLEDWTSSGKPLRRTEAVTVETITPGGSAFVAPSASPLPFTHVVRSLPRRDVPDIGTPYWVAGRIPWGFELVDRSRSFDTNPQSFIGESFVDTYRKDTYVVNVEISRSQPGERGKTRRITIERLGNGDLYLTPSGPQLAFKAGGEWWLTVHANFDVARLIEFAERLRPVSPPPQPLRSEPFQR